MTVKQFVRISVAATVILVASLVAAAQQPAAQKQQAKPAAKPAAPRVWTDENIDAVRSPSDDYQIQQGQEKAQQASAAQAAAGKNSQAAPPPTLQVKTVQEADTMIAARTHDLTSEQGYLQRLQEQLKDPSATGLEEKRLQWRLESHTATAQRLQSDIKQLQAEKDALAKKAAADKDASASQHPSQ
ncbi:MAG TPA: hypothetical protein VGU63_16610 [Candidatus Acidoferrales bacterium]|nr:hypothetical protein [Candidatus Acidoferrales bacterium]